MVIEQKEKLLQVNKNDRSSNSSSISNNNRNKHSINKNQSHAHNHKNARLGPALFLRLLGFVGVTRARKAQSCTRSGGSARLQGSVLRLLWGKLVGERCAAAVGPFWGNAGKPIASITTTW